MATHVNVTLMTPDASVAAAVEAAFRSNGHVLAGAALRDVRDLAAAMGRSAVALPVVVVDLDPQPQEVLREIERIAARYPQTRFVALAATMESNLLLEAMQSGIRRVVVKQSIAAELGPVLDRLAPAESADHGPRGDAVTILSASGGCGATTLAVNLADELAVVRKQPTLLCDLDTSYGAVASYLGIHPQYGADHVLNTAGTIDAQLIRSTSTFHTERVHVLASPASVNYASGEPMRLERLETMLDSARKAFATTVIDAPRLPIDAAATLVSGSNTTLLIFQLTVKDLRMARTMIDVLRERGVDTASILPIANRYAKRQMVSLEDASKALGGLQVLAIRNDYLPAIAGLNYGQLLSEAGPRSTLRKDVQELVARLQPAAAAQGAK